MSKWDKFCYYVGLAGLIGFPIVVVVDAIRFGLPEGSVMLRGVFIMAIFGFTFHQGRKAKQASQEVKIGKG